MAVYTVYQPPLDAARASPAPERFVFLRDGFSFWAFLFGPLWMLRHRMWLVLVCYVALSAILAAGLHVLQASFGIGLWVAALVHLLLGFEAGTLRRFTLARRGWKQVGLVVGDDLELAERRFFDAWVDSADRSPASAPPPAAPEGSIRPSPPEVLGLFPQPGTSP